VCISVGIYSLLGHSIPQASTHFAGRLPGSLSGRISRFHEILTQKIENPVQTHAVTDTDIPQVVLAQHPVHQDHQDIVFILDIRLLRLEEKIDSEIGHFEALNLISV
jgi:hypothetical protein